MLSSLFPQWMPPWAQAALVVGGVLFALVWLLVPFAVFGVKGRLDNLAVQLDDLQAQMRVMAMGLSSTQPPATPADMAASAPVPLWEPEPPVRRAAPPAPDYAGAESESDIPAYERRPARPQPVAPVRATAPVAPEPVRRRDEMADAPPVPPRNVTRPPGPQYRPDPVEPVRAPRREAEMDAPSPSLSEWSRRGADMPPAAVNRPVRASVWPPERGSRTEPTLRWPPPRAE
ncbi:hypothetical protein DY926_06865 [Komagataeibacter melaceti]|uniref:Uncharacterized protein n=1 Tax=Komagataeibacter melaceti TaxID=2766577 RepID=A0A371Z1K3_9PROT|nr:hypothetical protein [Komagataeibacter melaceti]RFD20279.1 hypothetical protein DY926_06865 [Komagataeibacter melaceti]